MLIFILIGSSCSHETIETEDVEKFLKEYKAEQYNLKYPNNLPSGVDIGNRVKKYLSKGALDKLNANQVFKIAPDFAERTNKTIELEDVILENEKENNDGSLNYKYTLKLKVSDEKSSEVFE